MSKISIPGRQLGIAVKELGVNLQERKYTSENTAYGRLAPGAETL
jgi:hypothetical protein